MNESSLKKAQMIMLDILTEVDIICQKHNIKYWLDSGTLLGAVRHKGFIPWDDDLDISMLLEDYEKFCKIAPNELKDGLFLQTKKTDPSFPYDIAKIRSDKGIIIEKHEANKKVKYNQGIFIDIIPVIKISNSILINFYYKIIFFLIKILSYKYLNNEKIRERIITYIDRFNNSNGTKIIRSGKFPSSLLYVDINILFPLKKIEFCDKTFYAPNNVDLYLKCLYGNDYMQLPAKEQQKAHALEIIINN